MGTVWKARQQSTRREIAIKFLHLAGGSEKAVRFFEREVEIASQLVHPNIARVYDSGVCQGVYYFTMELVEGVPLSLDPPDSRKALAVMWTVCKAMQYAHQRGVIHRDLKPSNILIDAAGEPHIVDFGLGKFINDQSERNNISIVGEWVGTPEFMSPEQASGKQSDTRGDVFSLGVILYRQLVGQPPYDVSGGHIAILRRLAEEEPMRPRKQAAHLSADLEAMLLKALARCPDERYPAAGAFADDIQKFLNGDPLSARAPTFLYFLRKKIAKHRFRFVLFTMILAAFVGLGFRMWAQVNREKDLALQIAESERAARRSADLRLSDGLATLAQSQAIQGDWVAARARFWESGDVLLRDGLRPTIPAIGLLATEHRAPLPICTVKLPFAVGQPIGGPTVFLDKTGSAINWMNQDGIICTTDLLTGQLVKETGQRVTNGMVLACAWCRDGSVLVRVVVRSGPGVGSPQSFVQTVDVVSGNVVCQWPLPQKQLIPLAASPDGLRLAVESDDSETRPAKYSLGVLDLTSGLTAVLPTDGPSISAIGFSPDSRRLAVADAAGEMLIFDTQAVRETARIDVASLAQLDVARDPVTRIAFTSNPNGIVFASLSGNVAFASIAVPSEVHRIRAASNSNPTVLSVSADGGSFLVDDAGGRIELWDLLAGTKEAVLGCNAPVESTTFSQDGRLAFAMTSGGFLDVWPLDPGAQSLFNAYTTAVVCLAISPDERIAAAGLTNRHVILTDIATGHELRTVATADDIRNIAFSRDGATVYVAGSDGAVLTIDTFGDLNAPATRPAGVASSDLSSRTTRIDGLQAAAFLNPVRGRVLWLTMHGAFLGDISTSQSLKGLDRQGANLGCLSDDGSIGLSMCGHPQQTLRIYNFDAGTQRDIAMDADQFARCAALAPDNSAAFIGNSNGNLIAYDLKSGQKQWTDFDSQMPINCLAVSSDGSYLLSGGEDGCVRLLDAHQGHSVATVAEGLGPVTSLVWSAKGNLIWCISHSTHATHLWDISEPQRVRDAKASADSARQLLAANPQDAGARASLAEWYFLRGRFDWASQLSDGANPPLPASHVSARARWQLGDLIGAATDFESLAKSSAASVDKDYFEACAAAARESR
jgi:WD40 repeat protein